MKITVEIPDDLLAKLDEHVAKHVEQPVTRDDAIVGFVRSSLAPLAVGTTLGQFRIADGWNIGLAEFPTGSRACLALSEGGKPSAILLLDDRSAAQLAQELLGQVKDRGPGPSSVPQ